MELNRNADLLLQYFNQAFSCIWFNQTSHVFDSQDVGATALARFAPALAAGPYAMLYVVNAFRNLTQEPADAVAVLREFEAKSQLAATAVVGNSHLQGETALGHIVESVPYTQAVASMAGLPVACITAPIQAIQRENTGPCALDDIPNGYAVNVYVKPPWF